MRLKQSVIERKARISGPAGIRRHERLLQAAQRRQQKQNSTLTSTYNNNNNNIFIKIILIHLII